MPAIEAAGVALGTMTLFQPTIKACFDAYGIHSLTANFGDDYKMAARKLQGQKARLDQLAKCPLSALSSSTRPDENSGLASQILDQLQGMRHNFQTCNDLQKHYSCPSPSPVVPMDSTSFPDPQPQPSSSEDPARTSSPNKLSLFDKASRRGRDLIKRPLFQGKNKDNMQTSSNPTPGTLTACMAPEPVQTSSGPNSGPQPACPTPGHAQSLATEQIPGILTSPSVVEARNKHEEDSAQLQRSTNFLKRGKWSVSDRKKFLKAVAELKDSIDVIESLLHFRLSTRLLEDLGKGSKLPDEVSCTQERLHQLHQALITSNGTNPEERLNFSIKLSTDHSQTKNLFLGHEGMGLTRESTFFILQAHEANAKEDDNESKLLVVESPFVSDSNGSTSLEAEGDRASILNLRQALVPVSGCRDPAFRPLGVISGPPQAGVSHLFHHAVDATGKRSNYLSDFLRVKELGDLEFANQHRYLAILLAKSLLYHFKTMPPAALPQPADYAYYPSPIAADSYMNPYLTCGLGPPRKKMGSQAIGAASGIALSPRHQIVALGLLLYQIGSWTLLDKELTGTSWTSLRTQAKGNLHVVTRRHGVRYSEIMQVCLDHQGTGETGGEETHPRIYEKVYMDLEHVRRELEK